MKITVGQLLIVVGVATYASLGPLDLGHRVMPMVDRVQELAAEKLPMLKSLVKGKKDAAEPPVKVTDDLGASDLAVADRMPAGEDAPAKAADQFSEVPLTPVAPANPPASPPPAPVEKAVAPAPKVESPKAEAPKVERARKKRVSARAPAKTSTAKASSAKKDDLVGTYVALTLKSGNVVKGILLQRTATNYKVELPGMGGFDYPANSVKKIAAAE